jgi:hypothetical protein
MTGTISASVLRSAARVVSPVHGGRGLGLKPIPQVAYNRLLREQLPRAPTVSFEDVTVLKRRLCDLTYQFRDDEAVECRAILDVVRPGDHVIVVGGGFGVSTVVAARAAGTDGQVTVFEAVPEFADLTRWAVQNNHTPAEVTIHRRPVGEVSESSAEQFGDPVTTPLDPEHLPDADVWHLDCEGAEEMILTRGDAPSRTVIEVHPTMCDEQAVLHALDGHERREKGPGGEHYIAVTDP